MPKLNTPSISTLPTRRKALFAALVGAVTLVHLTWLSASGASDHPVVAAQQPRPASDPQTSVHVVMRPMLAPLPAPLPVAVEQQPPRRKPVQRPVVRPAKAATDESVVIDTTLVVAEVADVAASAAASGEPSTESVPPALSPDPAPVTYATRIPRPFTYRYALQRGAIGGTAEISWKRDGDQYEARMRGAVGGIPLIGWTSTGSVDKTGLAPVRYLDHRIGKPDQAANFQRGESKITFSGSSNEYPLTAGAQDRLSWMIQLPAILGADPAKAKSGTRVAMFVVGGHGDGETWVFQSSGPQNVDTPSGQVKAVKWTREPRKAYDTKVEVWLDPARQYLPVRASMSSPPSDSPFDLQLVDAGAP